MSALFRWRRTAAAVQLAVAVLAMLECSSWQVQAGNPVLVLAERHPSQVRVTRSSGEPMVIKLPAVVGDSIIGRAGAVAVADVTAVSLRKFSLSRTLGLVAGTVAVTGLICALSDCFDFDLGGMNLGD